MSFSPALFLSHINSKEGLAKPLRYEVVIPIPQAINNFIGNSVIEQLLNLPNTLVTDITALLSGTTSANPTVSRYLALQCENAELPGKSLLTQEVKIYGPTFKVPYQTQFQDVPLTFMCTNDYYERKLFEKWVQCIMPLDTNNLRYPKEQSTRYLTNIKIIQYDEFVKQIFALELLDAYPTAIATQPLSWRDDGYHRLNVNFSYQKYRVIYEGTYDIVAALTAIFGANFANRFDRTTGQFTGVGGSLFANII